MGTYDSSLSNTRGTDSTNPTAIYISPNAILISMKLSDLDIDKRLCEILAQDGITDLYPPQEDAFKYALQGKSLVLAVPTASGKSLVAYVSILRSVLKGGKAIYIVPLRALASEKVDDLKKFEPLGLRVGVSVGDFDTPDPSLEKYDVIVATSEKADSLLRHRSHWLQKVNVVVADEVHLINDGDRGPTLEVTLAKFRQSNPEIQVIALSATIKNSKEIADWLRAEHVRSEWRPVVLKEGIFCEGIIRFADNTRKELAIRGDKAVALMKDVVKSGGQALIFVNTRRSAESLAEKCASTMKKMLSEDELNELGKISEDIQEGQDEPTNIVSKLASCVSGGAAFHNAGLTNEQRSMIERNFRSGRLKCIVATPTLAAGINMPARRVVIRDLKRYDEKFGYVPIPVLEVKQMMGRAGRPKYDKEGEAILLAMDEDEEDFILQNYILSETESISSKLGSEHALRTHILASIATGAVSTEESLYSFINETFFAHQNEVVMIEGIISTVLEYLEREKFIERIGDSIVATLFGKRTSDLYIDPLSAAKLREALDTGRDMKERMVLSYLHAACSTPDMQRLYLRRSDEWLEELVDENREAFFLPVPKDPNEMEFFYADVKTSCLIRDWIEEIPEDMLTDKYHVGPGDIRNRVELAEWLLYSMRELGRLLQYPHLNELDDLIRRVRYGVKDELLELVKLERIGRMRARALYSYGYRDRRSLRDASLENLINVPGIGKRLAETVKQQVAKRRDE